MQIVQKITWNDAFRSSGPTGSARRNIRSVSCPQSGVTLPGFR